MVRFHASAAAAVIDINITANAESINSTTNNIIAVNSRDILLTMSICKHSARSST